MRQVIGAFAYAVIIAVLLYGPLARAGTASDDLTFRGLKFGSDVRQQVPECGRAKGHGAKTCWEGTGDTVLVHFVDSLVSYFSVAEATQESTKLVSIAFHFTGTDTNCFGLGSLLESKYGDVKGYQPLARSHTWLTPTLQVMVYCDVGAGMVANRDWFNRHREEWSAKQHRDL